MKKYEKPLKSNLNLRGSIKSKAKLTENFIIKNNKRLQKLKENYSINEDHNNEVTENVFNNNHEKSVVTDNINYPSKFYIF